MLPGGSGYNLPVTSFPNASPGNNSAGASGPMMSSPHPPSTAEMNPGSVGLPNIPSPLASMSETKKDIPSKQDIFTKLVSSPSSGQLGLAMSSSSSSMIPANLLKQEGAADGGIPSLPSIKNEPVDDPMTAGRPSFPIKIEPKVEPKVEPKIEPKEEPAISSSNSDINHTTATPSRTNSPHSLPKPQPPVSSMPFSSEVNTGDSSMSSPLDSKKDLHTSTPPSTRNAGPLSQEGGTPFQRVSISSPRSEDDVSRNASSMPSMCKGTPCHYA